MANRQTHLTETAIVADVLPFTDKRMLTTGKVV